MFLALREVRRAPVRFGLLVAATALLVFLILVQQALRDGLITAFVGAVRNQSAPVLVYSVDAQRTLQGSVMPPQLEEAVLATGGIGAAARIRQGTFTVRVTGRDDDSDAALVGSDDPDLGWPRTLSAGRRPATAGEAVGSDVDFAVGDRVTVLAAPGAGDVTVTVVGLAQDVQLNVTPTLFTDLATATAAVRAVNPDAGRVPPNALALRPAAGVDGAALVDRINDTVGDAEALTRAQAADRAPGVDQVRQSFQVIFALYALVVPLVTGLFFLIATLQKARALTLLRAIGARAGTLAWALLAQVVLVIGLGLALGTALYAPLSQARVGGLALRFDADAVVAWSLLILVLGLASAAASLRHVLRTDPIEATTAAGAR
ncbi:MAG TPA: ABC transporter permease [Acidimicrobiales bacterium]